MKKKSKNKLFDDWPAKYDRWFTTPIGLLVKKYEAELILDLLKPSHGDTILDAGCGTGVFTADLISSGSRVIGLDLSLPMLARAREKSRGYPFLAVLGDMLSLPFPDSSFDLGIFFQHARFQPEISNTKLSRITFGNLFPQVN